MPQLDRDLQHLQLILSGRKGQQLGCKVTAVLRWVRELPHQCDQKAPHVACDTRSISKEGAAQGAKRSSKLLPDLQRIFKGGLQKGAAQAPAVCSFSALPPSCSYAETFPASSPPAFFPGAPPTSTWVMLATSAAVLYQFDLSLSACGQKTEEPVI